MPSPIGHALGGFACGWLIAGPPAAEPGPTAPDASASKALWRRPGLVRAAIFAALGTAADLDLLIGRHSQFTHSVGMAAGVGVAAFALLRMRNRRLPARPDSTTRRALLLAAAMCAAYASHILLDWLGQDATPPLGITALWPFTSTYYLSHAELFRGISREPWRPGAAMHDIVAILRELAMLGPPAVAAWWLRRRGNGQSPTWQAVPPATGRRGQHLQAAGDRSTGSESL